MKQYPRNTVGNYTVNKTTQENNIVNNITNNITEEVRELINSTVVICTYLDLEDNEIDCISDEEIAIQYNLEEVEIKSN